MMRFAVDGWDPGYGTSFGVDATAESLSEVTPDIELAPSSWRPIPPRAVDPPQATVFVDGVRRLEARLWISDPDAGTASGQASMALAASYAAGSVCCCDGRAHYLNAEVRRGLFAVAPQAADVHTWAGAYRVFPTVLNESQGLAMSLSASLQHQLSSLEIATAVAARGLLAEHGIADGRELLVVDGPVRGRDNLPRVLGFVKSHQITYLDSSLNAMVGTLAANERTPVFLLAGHNWNRFTWYLRLPCPPSHPWAGIARVECAANLPAAEAITLATLSQAVLPRFASTEYKDARAPQNLYPVAGLERELRRRLGHPGLLYRALRMEANGVNSPLTQGESRQG